MNNKLIKIFIIILGLISGLNNALSASSETEKKDQEAIDSAKMHLFFSKITDNNHTYIGEDDLLLIIKEKVKTVDPALLKGNSLEVGSGNGAAAYCMHELGFANVWGIDIDKEAVNYANAHYPEITFKEGDALKITKVFKDNSFSLVYMLNVASTINDTALLLQKVKNIATDGGMVAIIDYNLTDSSDSVDLQKPTGKKIHPLNIKKVEMLLKVIGWQVIEIKDLSKEYEVYYQKLVEAIAVRKKRLIDCGEFTKDEVTLMESYCLKILNLIKDRKLGGVAIFAKKV